MITAELGLITPIWNTGNEIYLVKTRWVTPTNLGLLWAQSGMFLLHIHIDNCPARFCVYLQMCPFINSLFFALTTNSELFSHWFKSAVIPGHTKPPNTQELASYSQKSWRLCFIFPCYRNKHRANLLHQRGPVLTCLSGGLLIFHKWFACFQPVLRVKYLQLSHELNIYEKHTCHWKNTGRVSRSVVRLVRGLLPVFVKEVSFFAMLVRLFPPAPAW